MGKISTADFKTGLKILIDNQPYVIVSNQFVKPGKGQAFNRTRVKNILTGKTIEKTFRSGDSFEIAEVHQTSMRLLYVERDIAYFMDDKTYEQTEVEFGAIGENTKWLKDDLIYELVFYNGNIISVTPPTFMNLTVTQTEPGARGDTASGKVLKPAIIETGAEVNVPIFITQDEVIRVDTRTGQYESRA
ncbi:elongation factor P [Chlamydiia bacterium]|nr:elongation factor P [Chlamydiia bacterium]